MKRLFLFISVLFIFSLQSKAFTIESTRFHCQNDTLKINSLLRECKSSGLSSPDQYMSYFADKLMETPYVAHTLEGDKEYLTINIDELDCTTFVETLIALTRSASENTPTWYTFASNLESIRYHDGTLNGYASRLHYISAWITENIARGYITEVTASIPRAESQIKSLYYMSSHRDRYAALSNDSIYKEIKNMESGYNMHRFPYINKNNLIKKDVIQSLRDGDIICLTTKTEGLDVTHLGIIRFKGDKPYLLHASSNKKKVIIDKYDLYEMIRTDRSCTGIRVLRVRGE